MNSGILAGVFLMALTVTTGFAQERLEDCQLLDWDYDPNPLAGFFRAYVSRESGVYPINAEHPALSRPAVVVPAIPSMVTEVVCARLQAVVRTPGTYYLAMTAVSRDMTVESEPSNEIMFTVGVTTVARPFPPSLMGGT